VYTGISKLKYPLRVLKRVSFWVKPEPYIFPRRGVWGSVISRKKLFFCSLQFVSYSLLIFKHMGELTFGEKAVGLTFNPGGDELVNQIKSQYAKIIDDLNAVRVGTEDNEIKRLTSVAITEAQGAQMWAVKAITWQS
jgi:hypothetical protein